MKKRGIFLRRNKKGLYESFIKRPMDFLLALFSIFFLSPLLLILYILIRLKLGSPVIFKQKRPGYKEKIFTMYKFRTMSEKKNANGELLPDNNRLNKFGKFLRSTSLDELPELFNILKGDMSFVGPRPLLIEYLKFYNSFQKKRHNVRPGLTGHAQVNGRNALSWEDKFNYDIKYLNKITFIGDLKIIILTIKKVIIKEGIDSSTSITMEKFKGNKKSNE